MEDLRIVAKALRTEWNEAALLTALDVAAQAAYACGTGAGGRCAATDLTIDAHATGARHSREKRNAG